LCYGVVTVAFGLADFSGSPLLLGALQDGYGSERFTRDAAVKAPSLHPPV
jgi:hypothetical protein